MSKGRIAAVAAASIMAGYAIEPATQFIAGKEGTENHAYVDVAGVTTICTGHTATAKLGQYLTDQQCLNLLKQDMAWTFEAINRNVDVNITLGQYVALSSFVFNFGEPAFRKSTLLKKLNAGQTKQACDSLMDWVCVSTKAGKGNQTGMCSNAEKNKVVLKGLVLRRADERMLCLEGINK